MIYWIKKYYKMLLSIVFTALAILAVGGAMYGAFMIKQETNIVSFEGKWDIELHSKSGKFSLEQEQTLMDINFYNTFNTKGSYMVCTKTIPELNENYDNTLEMVVKNCGISVSVDGKTIYEYGIENVKSGKYLGKGKVRVSLPDNCSGKEIKIVYYAMEDGVFTGIYEPVISSNKEPIDNYLVENVFNIIICSFLIVVGAFILIVSCMRVMYNKNFLPLIYIGLFSAIVGIFISCNIYTIQIVSTNRLVNTYVEYISLSLLPIPIFLIVGENYKNYSINFKRNMFICAAVDFLVAIVFTVLMLNNAIYPDKYVLLFLIFYLVPGALSLYLAKKMKLIRENLIFNIGFAVFVAMSALYVMSDWLITNYSYDFKYINFYLPIGAIVFVGCIFTDYMSDYLSSYKEASQAKKLEEIAFTDNLTGLYNRAELDNVLGKINYKEIFSVISLDLNYLKMTNDIYGHKAGDALLKGFSDILKKSLSELGPIFRMGGDEFLVVLEGSAFSDRVRNALDNMERLIDRENKKGYDYRTSVAYGLACSDEFEYPKFDKLNALADKRMYDMKKKIKEKDRKSGFGVDYVDDRTEDITGVVKEISKALKAGEKREKEEAKKAKREAKEEAREIARMEKEAAKEAKKSDKNAISEQSNDENDNQTVDE
ncbi:MAG: GGDEF domain-containing protein [Lachnospiraceae bacterium]|nr:GGDEF domain-containing protein [Lachnospiraceae bacterium]